MKVLTVQQPWAWAIMLGAKPVENRVTQWRHRGELGIHAGLEVDETGLRHVPQLMAADGWGEEPAIREWMLEEIVRGALLGTVDLADVHESRDHQLRWGPMTPRCCDTMWAEYYTGDPTKPVHLVLDDPKPLAEPIPCRGWQGLWDLRAPELEQLRAAAV